MTVETASSRDAWPRTVGIRIEDTKNASVPAMDVVSTVASVKIFGSYVRALTSDYATGGVVLEA